MKNFEKFKTASARTDAFHSFCSRQGSCKQCKIGNNNKCSSSCRFLWLEMECEDEEILPCPYCGKTCSAREDARGDGCGVVFCDSCGYQSGHYASSQGAIRRHNDFVSSIHSKK